MAFKPSASKKHDTAQSSTLNMNSMMDMMTIILLFLLKSYSTEGALASQSESLALPTSERTQKPKVNVSVASDVILVNEIPLMRTDEISSNDMMITPLQAKLQEYANKERQLEIEAGKEFTHEVIIQGDKRISFETLFKVMYTCSKTDFYKMRLLTVQSTSTE